MFPVLSFGGLEALQSEELAVQEKQVRSPAPAMEPTASCHKSARPAQLDH
jgi:hypothetical protein